MADGLQDAPPHAGQVVRRVLLRRNIAIDTETAQLVAAAVQAALSASTPPGRRAEARVFLPPTASRCSDTAVQALSSWPDLRARSRAAGLPGEGELGGHAPGATP